MPSIKEIIEESVKHISISQAKFKRSLREAGYPVELIKAIAEESEATVQYLFFLSKQNISNEWLAFFVQSTLQTRLNYINNTHAASIDSPVNVLSGLLCQALGLRFVPQVKPQTSFSQSAQQLKNGFVTYKLQLSGAHTKEAIGELSFALLLLRAVTEKNHHAVRYLLFLDAQNNQFLQWANNYFTRKREAENNHFLIDRFRELSRHTNPTQSPSDDLFNDFDELCRQKELEDEIELTDWDILAYYAELVAERFDFNQFPNHNQLVKIRTLTREVYAPQVNLTNVVQALRMPETPSYFLAPSEPECIARMPERVKQIIQNLEELQERTHVSHSNGVV